MKCVNSVVSASCALVLAACGGGGGGSPSVAVAPVVQAPPVVTVTNYPVESAIVGAFASTASYSVAATDTTGNSYTLNFTLAPGSDATVTILSPNPLKVLNETALLKKNGANVSTLSTSIYYALNPFQIYGAHDSLNDSLVVASKTALPQTSTVGTQGAIYSGSNYTNSNTLNGHAQSATWSLETDSASTAWLCINIQTATFGGQDFESDCFKINSAGVISGFKTDVTTSGVTLKFR